MRILGKEHAFVAYVATFIFINILPHFLSKTEVTFETYNMEAVQEDHGSHARCQNTRTKWSMKMNLDLVSCKEKAVDVFGKEACPRKQNGRKVGIMELTKLYWEELGYGYLQKSAQNLRDQVARIKNITQSGQQTVHKEISEQVANKEKHKKHREQLQMNNQMKQSYSSRRKCLVMNSMK